MLWGHVRDQRAQDHRLRDLAQREHDPGADEDGRRRELGVEKRRRQHREHGDGEQRPR